jgi:CspA family cold shock protein
MEQGSIEWCNDAKGYGVIPGDTGGEIFVHRAAGGLPALQQGKRIEFAAIRGLEGLQAGNVQGL